MTFGPAHKILTDQISACPTAGIQVPTCPIPSVFSHADRKPPQIRPLAAIRYFRALTAHKESTEYVFRIYDALAGNFLIKDLKRFLKSEKGQARITEAAVIPAVLDNHDYLKTLPHKTIGYQYYTMMRRENYTAAGLIAIYDDFAKDMDIHDDQIQWYIHLQRDTHDLMHVLSGYGTDAIGETCGQAFTWGQHKCLGALAIAVGGVLELSLKTPLKVNMMKIVYQAYVNGRNAEPIARESISALIHEPLEHARQRLTIAPPSYYHAALEFLETAGINPRDVLKDPDVNSVC